LLELAYPPSTNRYWRNMRGRMVKSKEAQIYTNGVKLAAQVSKAKLLAGPVSVSIWLHPKTKKDGTASETRLDLDNCLKVVIDALNGVAYTDDKQIVKIVAQLGEAFPGGGLTVEVDCFK